MTGHFGIPGMGAVQFSERDADLYWGGDESRIEVLKVDATIDSTAVDSGATPTNIIRRGMILGRVTSSSKFKEWNPALNDGSEQLWAVNPHELRMVDNLGVASDRFAPLVVKAPLQAAKLLILGAAFVGHNFEWLARRHLHLLGCKMDDDPQGFLSGLVPRNAIRSANYTVLASDNGTIFQAITANVTFTLPALRAGLSFEFNRVDGFNLVIASAEGDNMIVGNDNAADSITYSTAGNLIGARVRVTGMFVNQVLRWVPEIVVAPFSTGTLLTQTLAT